MPVDIFPSLNLPVIYVCQPYGGMDPAQMEGFLTNYYEYHFLYITGIHHVESQNIQGMALMKLYFHPGTNMAQAMAETVSYVNRARAFMPPGTVPPFVMRFDTGSVPVGYLVLSSETRSIGEIQDLALFRVRPMFASLPGVSAPPPFGGSQRTVVVTVDPQRLRAYDMSPDEVVNALAQGNTISPSGNLPLDGKYPIVPVNSVVRNVQRPGNDPAPNRPERAGLHPRRGLCPGRHGHADRLRAGQRPPGRLHPGDQAGRRLDLSVVKTVKAALPDMQAVLPPDIQVSFEFDQSPYVTRAIWGVVSEGALGAVLVGLMVLLFLRDWRSAIVVVLNIPLALMAAVVALWLTGQTINVMTLGGLALAIGILVDEATVEIENIHTQMAHAHSIADGRRGWATRRRPSRGSWRWSASWRCSFPRSSCRVRRGRCSCRCRWPSAFAMVASYLLSSTFVPVLSVWLLRHVPQGNSPASHSGGATAGRRRLLSWLPSLSLRAVPARVRTAAGADRPFPLGWSWPPISSCRWRSSGGSARGWARRSSRPSTPGNSGCGSAPRTEPTSTTPNRSR